MNLAETPSRIVRFSSHYDAAATATDNDWGAFFRGVASEEYYFNAQARIVALGRARREIRNNPYLAGLVNNYPCAIGYSNMRSRTSSADYNQKKDLWWYRLAKNFTNAGDSLRTMESIITRELLIAGEIFLVLLTNGKVQLISSEFCGSPSHSIAADATEINGITYAATGLPTAYRFGRMTPLGWLTFEDSVPVPARYVIHVYDKDRVQMGRGLPWLLPSLKTARDLYEVARSKTKQIKDANSISGTLEMEAGEQFLQGLKAPTENSTPETKDSPVNPVSDQPTIIELKPGTFIALKPGEKLNQLKSQYNASDYKELIFIMLHAISTPLGLPVELWFSGLGDVSYSGFKGLGTQWDGRRREVTAFLEDRFLNRLQFWRVSKAANEGDLPPNPDQDDDLVDWAWKRTPVLDEEKNAKANQLKLNSGELSLADVWEQQGLYPEEVFAHRRELWIKMQIAAGNLKEGDNHDDVKVPEVFLLRGLLPGEKSMSLLAPSNSPASGPAPTTESDATPPPAKPKEEGSTGGAIQ